MKATTLRRVTAGLAVLTLAACGSGGSGDPGGGGDNGGGGGGGVIIPQRQQVDGFIFQASRNLATQQAPLAGATVSLFTLPQGDQPLAVTTADARGRFVFSVVAGSLPTNRTLLLVASGSGHVVMGLVILTSDLATKNLNEVTHIAGLAAVMGQRNSLTASEIVAYETVARRRVEAAANESDPVELTADPVRAQAVATATLADLDGGGASANRPPVVSNVLVTPTQLSHTGGTVAISLDATDPDGDPLTVVALLYAAGATTPRSVGLTANGSTFTGSFEEPANGAAAPRETLVAIVADDGVTAPVPAVVRTVRVLPDGLFYLDVLAETLFDEPASRQVAAIALDRMRSVRIRRGGEGRSRQVNPNQSIRGATVTVVDGGGQLVGITGNDGLVLLQAPLSLLDDRALTLTAAIGGRVVYRQHLLLPTGATLLQGDTVEVDLVLATAGQWQEFASLFSLGVLDFDRVPLTSLFNVLNSVNLHGAEPAATLFRPIDGSPRNDDGDLLLTNLPAAALTISGQFADANNPGVNYPFGAVTVPMAVGQVTSLAVLIPPQG